MTEQNDNNKRKSKLIMFMLIAIIAVLFAGIVYQFIVIKKLEKQVNSNTSSYICVVDNNTTEKFFN